MEAATGVGQAGDWSLRRRQRDPLAGQSRPKPSAMSSSGHERRQRGTHEHAVLKDNGMAACEASRRPTSPSDEESSSSSPAGEDGKHDEGGRDDQDEGRWTLGTWAAVECRGRRRALHGAPEFVIVVVKQRRRQMALRRVPGARSGWSGGWGKRFVGGVGRGSR